MQLKLVFFFAFTIITVLGAATVNQCIGYLQDVEKSVGTLTAGIENFNPTNLWDAWVGDSFIRSCTENLRP